MIIPPVSSYTNPNANNQSQEERTLRSSTQKKVKWASQQSKWAPITKETTETTKIIPKRKVTRVVSTSYKVPASTKLETQKPSSNPQAPPVDESTNIETRVPFSETSNFPSGSSTETAADFNSSFTENKDEVSGLFSITPNSESLKTEKEYSSIKTEEKVCNFMIDAQKREAEEKAKRIEMIRNLSVNYEVPQIQDETWDSIYPSSEDTFDSNNPKTHIGLIRVCKALRKRKELKLSLKKTEFTPDKAVDPFIEKLEKLENLFLNHEKTLSMYESTENTPDEPINGETLSFKILRSISAYLMATEMINVNYKEVLDTPLVDLADTEHDHSGSLKTWLDVIDHIDRGDPIFLDLFLLPPSKRKSSYENPPPSLDSASLLELSSEEQPSEDSNVLFDESKATSPSFAEDSEEIIDPFKIHKTLCSLFIFLNTQLEKKHKSFSLGLALYAMKEPDKVKAYSILSKAPPIMVTYFLLYSNFFFRQEIFRIVSDPRVLFNWLEQAFKNNWRDEDVSEFLKTFSPLSRNLFLEYFEEHTSKELKDWILKNHETFFDPIPEVEEVSNGCSCYCS